MTQIVHYISDILILFVKEQNMSLETGILGFLSFKMLSGYDLKKLFDMSASFFWPADQAQIYRSLKHLSDNEHIVLEEITKDEGPNKKLYAITEKGHEYLRQWLMSPDASDFVTRAPYVMQLFFSGELSPEEQLRFIDKHIMLNNKLIEEIKAELL